MSDFLSSYWLNLLIIPSLLVGYTAHELGHAIAAYVLGDFSQVERGKISLNPLKHLSWFGALAFIIFGLGWPKPIQVNPYNFKRKYLDLSLVALAGPIASLTLTLAGLVLTLGLAAALIYYTGVSTDTALIYVFPFPAKLPSSLNTQATMIALTGYMATTNFWLTFVSLVPLPGLDGFVILISLISFFRARNQPASQTPQVQRQIESTLTPESPLLMSQQKRRNAAADIHFKTGIDYHQANKYDDAIARYRQAIKSDSHFGPAYVNMGLAYLAKNDRKRAIQSFRGATQYADDQRSQAEAWYQLQQLSEISMVNEEAAKQEMTDMGAAPWTDTHARPNWLGLGLAVVTLVIGGLALYSYLLARLITIIISSH